MASAFGVRAVELCVGLQQGGLTPSLGTIEQARALFQGELAVLFRPRSGDFVYDKEDKKATIKDISAAVSLGIDTVVAGGLAPNGALDCDFLEDIVNAANGTRISFHRAIDVCPQPEKILEQLIEKKVHRVLSSGRKANAWEGIKQLNEWVDRFGNAIEISAGGGLRPQLLPRFLQAFKGRRLHASLSKAGEAYSGFLPLGDNELADEQQIIELMNIIRRHNQSHFNPSF